MKCPQGTNTLSLTGTILPVRLETINAAWFTTSVTGAVCVFGCSSVRGTSFKLGEYLDMADRKEEAITCYTKLIERYDDSYLENVIDIVFRAYLAKAINLIALKQTNQAREVFKSMLIEFGEEERFKKEISEVKGYINKL